MSPLATLIMETTIEFIYLALRCISLLRLLVLVGHYTAILQLLVKYRFIS